MKNFYFITGFKEYKAVINRISNIASLNRFLIDSGFARIAKDGNFAFTVITLEIKMLPHNPL
ncbi:hypothetical protein J2795_003081 [Chryseobacterium bernardetii]|jgi:hypothetical protein|uniref:Uncharacterized protein n=2 Tax=Chryseobacterium TaxID=59732 RepID=A0A543EKX6_9FLAO|nr:hypothetical protein [Chryseobacterium vietnamense]MDR6372260.1 hypothetical protein [Chryseobacterium vietnamense]MDR6442356.1 hypothetical protein [Chryseobacterium bernardetii]TQM22237.1 hypothetical protein FB551_1946 [Chryseobacterium aquifrigidense]